MDYLEFDEKLKIKEFVEKKIYIKEKNREKINLLKGSLSIKNKEKVEKLLNDKKYYYESQGEEKEARSFCIGKAIVILNKERNIIKEFISLNNLNDGIDKYMELVNGKHQGHMEYNKEVKGKIDILAEEFNDLGKWNRIEKGRILKEIDAILSEDKMLGKKEEMWERLNIKSYDKSILCKRYNLFLEFKDDELFAENKNYMRAIENMINDKVKEITKENKTKEEKITFILQEISEIEGRV